MKTKSVFFKSKEDMTNTILDSSNLTNKFNHNTANANNSKNHKRKTRRERAKKNKWIMQKRNRQKEKFEENSLTLNNVPSSSNRHQNISDQGSSINHNVTEPLNASNLNSFGSRNDPFNVLTNSQTKKKNENLQTKKLLRKSVLNLNNRNNRTANRIFANNQRNVKLKKHQRNIDKDCFILVDQPTEIIVLDDDDDDTKQNNSKAIINNGQSHSLNDTNINCNNYLTESTPMDIDKDDSEIEETNPEKHNSQFIRNSSIINISDSLNTSLFKKSTNKNIFTSNKFYEDVNKDMNLNKMSTPSYVPIRGFRELNKTSPECTEILSVNKTISDDSVIFVSESIDLERTPKNSSVSKAENFIPLSGIFKNKHFQSYTKVITSPTKKNLLIDSYNNILNSPFKKFEYKNCSTPKFSVNKRLENIRSSGSNKVKQKGIILQNRLLTAHEVAQNTKYSTNTYNPKKEEILSKKRMVIIDGSNVAFAHALSKEFSVKGLEICIEYFFKMGHEVKAIVPQFRLQKYKSTDPGKLEELNKSGKIVFTPCKNLPGKSSTCYDDRFILQLAVEFDAAVVSNDNYRDLINENVAFKKIIENRVIGYTWCNDMFILPKDPYGKNGPGLSVILNRI